MSTRLCKPIVSRPKGSTIRRETSSLRRYISLSLFLSRACTHNSLRLDYLPRDDRDHVHGRIGSRSMVLNLWRIGKCRGSSLELSVETLAKVRIIKFKKKRSGKQLKIKIHRHEIIIKWNTCRHCISRRKCILTNLNGARIARNV